MNSNELAQKMIDEATSVYDIGEGTGMFNKRKMEKSKSILEDMQYDYKSFNQLSRLDVKDLQKELNDVREHILKLKNIEKVASHLIKMKSNNENKNSNTEVNQIRKRA